MAKALALHEQIAAAVVGGAGGVLLRWRGEGDSTFSVFTDPVIAVAVAVAVDFQRALRRATWPPDSGAIRARSREHWDRGATRRGLLWRRR